MRSDAASGSTDSASLRRVKTMTRRQQVQSALFDELQADDLDQLPVEKLPEEMRQREDFVSYLLYDHERSLEEWAEMYREAGDIPPDTDLTFSVAWEEFF
jgi:hypothetical protein